MPADCRTDSTGAVTFTYPDAGGVGTDSVLAFVDDNTNGAPDIGEAQTTAALVWAAAAGAAWLTSEAVAARR